MLKKLSLVFLIAILQIPFVLKAQIDRAFLQNEYTSQYIFPPMIDPISYPSREIPNALDGTIVTTATFQLMYDVNWKGVVRIAQRYEVQEGDSVSLMGTAFLISAWYQEGYNTIKVGVWDKNLTTEIYSKEFMISAENFFDVFYGWVDLDPWIECIFDDTLTLYEDYYISLESYSAIYTPGLNPQIPPLILEEYCVTNERFANGYCAPYGISTKYKPYVQFEDSRSWIYVDDVQWEDGNNTYDAFASPFMATSYYEVCDTVVCLPWGYCAIKVAEDTTTTGLTSVFLSEESVELYPNPASDELNISCDYNILEIEVFDALNRLVYEQKSNSKNIKLNVSQYKSGTYILRIKTEKGKIDKKFIVN
jgi:hypothetical protein